MDRGSGVSAVSITELLAAISLATDLGTGQPLGHALRTCVRSVRVARELGLADDVVREVHHVALLRFIGCTSDASDTARMVGGDNRAFVSAMAPVLHGGQRDQVGRFVRSVGADQGWARRARLVAAGLADPGGAARSLSTHCEVAARLGTRLGLDRGTVDALAHAYERWDGAGFPSGLAGEEVPISVRVVSVVRDAELFAQVAPSEADAILHARRGRAYDPAVVDVVLRSRDDGDAAGDNGGGAWDAALAAEPGPTQLAGPGEVDTVLEAVADFADLYIPWTRGRAHRVAQVARDAARACGLTGAEAHRVWRAGLVQDVGRVGVAAGVWNHPGPLDAAAWEQVRLHPYLTERVLTRCAGLAGLAAVAGAHQERLDGSGYHRGCQEGEITTAARLLAAADVLVATTEARPHRPALDEAAAVATLREEATAGRLGTDAVDAVCVAAGHVERVARRGWPSGLTGREVDVLRLIARGRTNREVAAALHLSPKTVGRHIENLYGKTGVSSRAAAALFAMEHRLLDPP
ncbi:MAG: HD domain-containing phosphohydrolase [Acidimicrobiia bacterium]